MPPIDRLCAWCFACASGIVFGFNAQYMGADADIHIHGNQYIKFCMSFGWYATNEDKYSRPRLKESVK